MLEVNIKMLNDEQKVLIDDLGRYFMLEIARSNEGKKWIDNVIFTSVDDFLNGSRWFKVSGPSRYLALLSDGAFRCRKLNHLLITNDNTKNTCLPSPNEISQDHICWWIKIGMIEPIEVNSNELKHPQKWKLSLLHP